MGIDLDITTYVELNLSKLENAYGKSLTSVMEKVKKVNVVSTFNEDNIKRTIRRERYDIHINTHADLFPYYQDYFSKKNMLHTVIFLWQKNILNLEICNILKEILG